MNGWTAIVPVKPWRLAKSRLDHPRRGALARAFSLDTIEAVAAAESVRRVVVVSAETQLAVVARRLGATLLLDQPLLPAHGLDAAIDVGRRWAAHRWPTAPVVVVPGDLPSLCSEHLDETLARLRGPHGSFVPDREGTGTTLLAACSPWQLRASYGPGSAQRHRSSGLVEVVDVVPAVRSDVDTMTDLRAASTLGLGPHTAAALSDVTRGRAQAGLQSR